VFVECYVVVSSITYCAATSEQHKACYVVVSSITYCAATSEQHKACYAQVCNQFLGLVQ